MTATISGVGVTHLQPGCTALTGLDRATDPAFEHFMSATASAIGSSEVSISLEVLSATGSTKLHAAQVVTVTQ